MKFSFSSKHSYGFPCTCLYFIECSFSCYHLIRLYTNGKGKGNEQPFCIVAFAVSILNLMMQTGQGVCVNVFILQVCQSTPEVKREGYRELILYLPCHDAGTYNIYISYSVACYRNSVCFTVSSVS